MIETIHSYRVSLSDPRGDRVRWVDVEALTAADAVTQVQIQVRNDYPPLQVCMVVPRVSEPSHAARSPLPCGCVMRANGSVETPCPALLAQREQLLEAR